MRAAGLVMAGAAGLLLVPVAGADQAPVPDGYQAPLTSVEVFTAWEAPLSSVSIFSTAPQESEPKVLEESLDATQEGDETVVQLPDRFLFDFASAQLRPTAASSLDTIVALLDETESTIKIIGHTDNVGDDEVNQPLSEQRAQAIADYLVTAGMDSSRITSSGKGSSDPVAENTHSDGRDNPDGRQQNRRVEIRYSG